MSEKEQKKLMKEDIKQSLQDKVESTISKIYQQIEQIIKEETNSYIYSLIDAYTSDIVYRKDKDIYNLESIYTTTTDINIHAYINRNIYNNVSKVLLSEIKENLHLEFYLEDIENETKKYLKVLEEAQSVLDSIDSPNDDKPNDNKSDTE